MTAPKQLQDCVARVLKTERRKGQTTKQGAVILAMNVLSKGGNGYALPSALMHVAAKHIVALEVDRQLKHGLPDNVIHGALRNAPPELVQILSKLPAWIAVSEGIDARWVPSLLATASDWTANARLKEMKARQTMKKANVSADIARYLAQYGMHSLSETLDIEQAA